MQSQLDALQQSLAQSAAELRRIGEAIEALLRRTTQGDQR